MPIKWGQEVGKTGKVRKYVEVTVSVKGVRRHRQLSGSEATQRNAETLEKQLKQELVDEVVLGKKPPVPIAVALDRYLTEQVYGEVTGRVHKAASTTQGIIRRLTPWIIGKTIDEVVEVSRTMTRDMLKLRRSPSTINSYLCALRRAAHLSFTDWDYLDVDIAGKIRDVPGVRAKKVRLEVDEVWALVDKLKNQEIKDFVLVSVYTGFRHEEMELILADDRWVGPPQAQRLLLGYKVDFERGLITIPDQKNGEEQWHPLVRQAMEPIKRSFPLKLSRSARDKYVRQALDAIGRPDCTIHTLRKSTGSILLDQGVSLETVQQVLRHQTIDVTAKSYAFMNVQTKRKGMELLETALQRPQLIEEPQ